MKKLKIAHLFLKNIYFKAFISKKLVTLKNDVPIKNDPNEFLIKGINKNKLYEFLRNMEFNRLLSQAISFYGEPNNKEIKSQSSEKTTAKINTKSYKSIQKEKELDDLIKKFEDESNLSNLEYILT